MDSSVISPELALVDPELAEAARKRLPALPAPSPPVGMAPPVSSRARRRSRVRRALRAALLVAAAIALGYATAWLLVLRTQHTIDTAPLSPRTTTSVDTVQAPRAAPPAAAVRLIWRPVTAAAYYDVILWRGHTRVLDLWPAKHSVNLPPAWQRAGATKTLLPGRYRWFVYPGFGARSAHRFGPLAASGTFVVGKP